MKTWKDILQIGDPRLYEVCTPILPSELDLISDWVKDLHEAMESIKDTFGFGRGIAAPQLGIMKRLVYVNIDKPVVLINPEIVGRSDETFQLWDDCMSFPNLLVKVNRHQSITLQYRDQNWNLKPWRLENDLAELLQHECDHLDGVLCTMRAIDHRSFKYRNTP